MKNCHLSILLLFTLFALFSCSNQFNSENDSFKNTNTTIYPDLAIAITKDDIRLGKIEGKIDSISKNWEGLLQILIEDKGLTKINEQGLYLRGFIKINDRSKMNDYLKGPLTSSSHEPIYNVNDKNSLNTFTIKQPYLNTPSENVLKSKNEYLKKGIQKLLKNLGNPSELNLAQLKWEYKGEIFYSMALFTGNRFIYDEVIANLREVNYSVEKNQKSNNKAKYKNMNSLCDSLIVNKAISYSDGIHYTRTGPFGSAWGEVSITISGELEISNCTKYIQTYSSVKRGDATFGYSHDEKVGVDFLPAGVAYDGHCNYEIAVGLAGYTFFGTVVLKWDGYSISLEPSSASGSTFSSRQNYVTPSMLH